MYKAKRDYISPDDGKLLLRVIKTYHQKITSDNEFSKYTKYWSQERWTFFNKHFTQDAYYDIGNLVKGLTRKHSLIKATIHENEIFEFIKERMLYDLTFKQWQVMVPMEAKNEATQFSITFEPRFITLKSVILNKDEYETLLNILDEHIVSLLSHYKNHRSLVMLHAANIELDKSLNWSFGQVFFISKENNFFQSCYAKWVKSIYLKRPLPNNYNIGVIKFKGCSGFKAMAIGMKHFNRAYNCLKMVSELCLNKQYWTSRDYLEIPNQSLDIISSHDTIIGSAIEASLDNDFYSALSSNSMYKPVVLNKSNVSVIDNFEYKKQIDELLNRSLSEDLTEIDQKIFNALSWFSESQKSFVPVHKYVGFVTSLETLLTNKSLLDGETSHKGIAEMLSERGAILLKGNYSDRVLMKKELKRIYGIRSKIVHGTERQINTVDPHDFMDNKSSYEIFNVQKIVAQIVAKVIYITAKENIKNIADLNEYFQKTLLS